MPDIMPACEDRAAPNMTARRWPFAVSAIVLGVAAAALIAEVTARVAGAAPLRTDDDWQAEHRRLYQTSQTGALPYDLRPSSRAVFAYRGQPVEYRINEDGIRADRRYAIPKPAGVRRIVMLGDSVLFGLGVAREATFAARVEAALGVEVVNGGIGGYNTAAERLWFDGRGRRYEPDAVVLVYCPNDVDDPVDHFSAHTAERLSQQPEEMIPNPAYHAQAAALQVSTGPRPQRSWRVAAAETADWTMRQSALAALCLRPFAHGGSRPYERCLLSAADSASKELAWLRRQLAGLRAQTNAPAYFVYVPIAYELHSNNAAYRRGRANVARAAVDAGFRVVDVIAPLEAVPTPYLDVTHLSAAGHAIVADVLIQNLR